MAITGEVTSQLKFKQTSSPDRGQGVVEQSVGGVVSYTNGTNNNQADLAFLDSRQLASGATENLDLAGVLAGAFGATLTFAKIAALSIEADDANTTNLTFGGAGSNTWVGFFADATDKIIMKPGAKMTIHAPAGWTVTAGTGDILLVANAAGAAANYTIGLLGRSA